MVEKKVPEEKKIRMPRGKKKLMIEALNSQMGIVTTACKQVGIDRRTHSRWMKEDEAYKFFVEEAKYNLKDFGENALLKLMKSDHPGAIIFFNKTKNKDRGYYEKNELEHTGDSQSNIFNLVVKSVEEIKRDKLDNQSKAA